MIYRNAEIKVEQLVTYFNNKKINLSPAFQRGHVWTVTQRRKLLKNMIQRKPIPAIFLYKEASGSTYTYNILDGKQRLESLMLFIGSERRDLFITNWNHYFSTKRDRKEVNFWVDLDGKRPSFATLDDDVVRNFGEYVIPAIEITLDDNTSLDDIISLFVDINQQGVAVKRFDIVKAMCQNADILKQTFDMIAIKQHRGEDIYYKMKNNDITYVLKRLGIIVNAPETNSRVDRMWERLLEISIFSATRAHRKPVDVLKGFINLKEVGGVKKLDNKNVTVLKIVFGLLRKVYVPSLIDSKLATDGTHFYTMVTTLVKDYKLRNMSKTRLIKNLTAFSKILNDNKLVKLQPNKMKENINKYLDLSSKHTTDISRRSEREILFAEIVKSIKTDTIGKQK